MIKSVFINVIQAYQITLSVFLGANCRFHPSCSEYTRQAIETHGGSKGLWLAVKRLSKCHPFHSGGFDPVPGCDSEEAC